MKSNIIKTFLLAAVMILCASCSGIVGQMRQSSSEDSKVRSKVGAGILMMEGTDLEVTTEQAKSLLPLWKAVKNLSNDSSIPEAEITAVYRQMQESLSADQIQTIQSLNWSASDLNTLVERYDISMTNTGGTGKGSAAGASQSQNGTASNPGAGMPVGGGPGGDPAGGIGMGDMGGAPQTQSAAPSGASGVSGDGEMNLVLADAVISVLQVHMDA